MLSRHGQRQSPGGGGDTSDSDDHHAPPRGIEDGITPERAGSFPIDTHEQSFRYLLPNLSRTCGSFSVKSRFGGDVEDGVRFDGRRPRYYRLIGPVPSAGRTAQDRPVDSSRRWKTRDIPPLGCQL
jgi:hypothetical protein